MKNIVILIAVLFLSSGCATSNYAKKDQLQLNVPPQLLEPPSELQEL